MGQSYECRERCGSRSDRRNSASWAMNLFQRSWSEKTTGISKPHGAQACNGIHNLKKPSAQNLATTLRKRISMTERLADVLSTSLTGHRLTPSQRGHSGRAIHYAFGISTGLLYGGVAELIPEIKAGAGSIFGALYWLVVDEGLVPALRLSKPPRQIPIWVHSYALSSHLVYGVTTELIRRLLRRRIG